MLYLFRKTDAVVTYQPGEEDRAVERAFAGYLGSLASGGHPNAGSLLEWPRSDEADSYLELASPLRLG